MAFVKLSAMPDPPVNRVSNIPSLAGGLNVHDTPWRIGETQSPEMRNMWWEDGALRSRPAQITKTFSRPETGIGEKDYAIAVYPYLYHGWYIIHRGTQLLAFSEDLGLQSQVLDPNGGAYEIADNSALYGKSKKTGTFVLHNGTLYYKAAGTYISIKPADDWADEERGLRMLEAADVAPYIPTVLINADPASPDVGGDLYQPANRLTTARTVQYNGKAGVSLIYLPERPETETLIDPESGLTHKALIGSVEYLTESGKWRSVDVSKTTVELKDGKWAISLPNPVLTEDGQNNLRVTYDPYYANAEDYADPLMSCDIAAVYGGGEGLCMVLAGCATQPNAYFWSANTDVSMDPGYFPVEHYNLAGDFSDPITTFGQQQNMLVVFQKNRTGAATFGTREVDGRTFITMDYRTINPQIGCDAPGSVQLVENNLVFANSRLGVLFLRDTTSADENNLVRISTNLERSSNLAGLMLDLKSDSANATGLDDGERYWLCVNGHAWLWDYRLGGSLGNPQTMAWFYFDNIQRPAAWFGYDGTELPRFIGRDGYLRFFSENNADTNAGMGEDFEKVVALPIQNFGTYEVLKNVNKVIFELDNAGSALIDVEYQTDYETRKDRTPINGRGWQLVPRNLSYRSLWGNAFAVTAVRKPRCLHVRHFMVRLKNNTRGEKMSLLSAQIHYTTQGADR